MAKFKFYGTLKQHVSQTEMMLDGNRTISESLADIAEQHLALKAVLFDEATGVLHDYFVVILNEEQAQFLDDGMETRLKAEDVVQVFPPVSGG